MQVIKDNKSLAQTIAHLENVQRSEGNLLKEHFKYTMHNLNPLNVIKDKFKETVSSPTLKGDLINGAIGLATGMLSNKLILGSSNNPIKKVLANVVQAGVSKFVTTHPESIKDTGKSFLKKMLEKLKIKS